MSEKEGIYSGSCLCGNIRYQLLSEPKHISHCHCNMCQKQHGAAFATYASVPLDDLVYSSGLHLLAEYCSSGSIIRTFCKICGSNLEWRGSPDYSDWVSIAIATLDTPYKPGKISNIHTNTKVSWLP